MSGDSLLPTSARDVIIITADFSRFPGDALDHNNLIIISEIDKSIQEMEGLRRHSSLLSTSVVKAQHDEILIMPFIPLELITSYDSKEILQLKKQYFDFPEIWPYVSSDFTACVFYLEPGLTYPEHLIVRQVEELQEKIGKKYGITFEFTGLRPIKVFIERFLSRDILKILPLLFLLISGLYYIAFRNIRVLMLAWFIKVLSTAFAYGCYRFFMKGSSPLIILVPAFNFGLLSDYLIHMFYHLQGRSGLHSWRSARNYLIIPLSLTAATSIIGFLSLTLLGGTGHILLSFLISMSILLTYLLTLWWLPSVTWTRLSTSNSRSSARSIPTRINRALTILFVQIYKNRIIVFALCIVILIIAIIYLPNLELQPYPLQQLPKSSTIIKAESLLNEKFSGTVPFMLEIDAKQASSFISRRNLRLLEDIHHVLRLNRDIGFQHSVLTIIKRIHYYFNNSDPRYLAIPDEENEELFTSLIEQYLLFYSASASPEVYESLIDSNYRIASIQGILKYEGTESIGNFLSSLSQIRELLPSNWSVNLFGPLNELVQRKRKLENNWFLSFGIGSILIFITVLVFFKNIKMSLISLIPSFSILLVVAGISAILNIKIDEYTIIIVAISTGLTIDYTIHMLNAIRNVNRTSQAPPSSGDFKRIIGYGYTLVRNGAAPVFLSFVTSILAFAALFFSSFPGAVHLAFLLSAAIGSAFFIGVFLLPLFFIPGKIKRKKMEP
ncbi:MAG TPA: hypothetical protein ENI15_16030 [Spirochaetes bacterium]|nr:hypothetical protein [Spirochaetota bacterium]